MPEENQALIEENQWLLREKQDLELDVSFLDAALVNEQHQSKEGMLGWLWG